MNRILCLLLLAMLAGCSRKTTSIESFPEPAPVVQPAEKPIATVAPAKFGQQSFVDYVPAPSTVAYFDFDEATLSDVAAMAIDAFMAKYGGRGSIVLTGGACPIGTEDYNYRLGLKRAQAVADYITRIYGDQKALHVLTVGENDPVATDPEQYNLNRRCIIEEK